MTQLNQIYKCNVCGNIVAVVHAGAGELVCCGQPMQLQLLKPGQESEAGFTLQAGNIIAREYCNLHGLWRTSDYDIS